jgi:hypothetical protein
MPDRVAKLGDVWADLLETPQRLEGAIERLRKMLA